MLNHNSKLLFATLTLASPVHAAGLNDTGIKTCSNETQNGLPCPVAGFPGQDAKSVPILKTAEQWSSTGSMSTVRAGHTATPLPNGKVLVAGGCCSSLSSAEIYNPSGGSWSSTGSMSTARYQHTATLLPTGKVLVAGGSGSSAEIYDPSTGSWSSTGSMSKARHQHTATLLPNGKVLVAGGSNGSSAEIYDPSTGSWSSTGAMSTARRNHTATLLPSGKVLVAGGSYYLSLSSAEIYNPSGGSWSSTGSMSTARCYHTATLLPSGKVLVVAGNTSSAEIYNPSGGSWSSTGSMSTDLYYHTATLLPSGKVLVAGGYYLSGGKVYLSSAKIYDPSTGSWSSTSSMSTGRGIHTATLLPSGKVLVAGGEGSSGYLSSTELYEPAAPTLTAPAVSTDAPSLITATNAILKGTVNPNGAATTVTFDFGATTSYGTSLTATPNSIAATAAATAVSADKTGLSCGTTYHYRVTAVNSVGISRGTDKTFTTSTCPPQPVNGVCGSSNNNSFNTTPSTNLCSTGTVSGFSGTGPWNWSCAGSNGGTNASCTANINRYTVNATAGTGGTVNPSNATVNYGTKASFTVTANSGYTRNNVVGGTCPQGSWNGNVWTTETIVANCSVSFSFTPPIVTTYTVTPSANPVAGGSFDPAIAQTVNAGTTTSFTVIPSTNSGGYVTNPVVTGTCPPGSWGGTWNNVWTTGTINQHCTVIFSFTAVNAWIAPPNQTIIPDQPFTLDITVKSNSVKVGRYDFVVTFDTTKLRLDTTYTDATGLCVSGICPGTSALANRLPPIIDGNTITLTGYDSVGKGPSNDLQLLVMHFRSRYVADAPSFVTGVALKTNILTTAYGDNIGTGARGATVNVSTGLCGDADGNTSVNIVDALAIARKVVGMPPPPTVEDVLADVNEDGRVAITDALHVARYSVGLVIPPEVCKIGQAF